jgi:hypothetical protein
VVLGSSARKVRDAKARELLSKGLMQLIAQAPPSAPGPGVNAAKPMTKSQEEVKADASKENGGVIHIKKGTVTLLIVIISGILVLVIVLFAIKNRRSKDKEIYLDNIP